MIGVALFPSIRSRSGIIERDLNYCDYRLIFLPASFEGSFVRRGTVGPTCQMPSPAVEKHK
jgi:hypothetical protein